MSVAATRSSPLLELVRRRWSLAALIVVSILVVVGALFLVKADPGKTLSDFVHNSLGTPQAITGTLREVTPLLISGIAVFLALQAGLFNIGVEGQFTVGALAAAMVALAVPGLAGILLAILAGSAAGALWALPAGWIKAVRGGHEVITTIMLNNVAGLLTMALVAGPLKDPNDQSATTSSIGRSSYLPSLVDSEKMQISSGLLVGVLIAGLLWWWLTRTVSGYELRAVGANATAARFAGVDAKKVILRAMVWSGAIGGLGGAIQVLAFEHRFYPDLSSGYGFDALGVAMLAGGTPIGLLPTACLFGILSKGGNAIQIYDQVPKGITSVILGLLIVIAAAIRYRKSGDLDA